MFAFCLRSRVVDSSLFILIKAFIQYHLNNICMDRGQVRGALCGAAAALLPAPTRYNHAENKIVAIDLGLNCPVLVLVHMRVSA